MGMSYDKNPEMIPKERIAWIDFAKAIGIFLIVMGHTLKGGHIHQFLYAFHIPMFFFLSGASFSRRDGYLRFLWRRTRGLLIPYWLIMGISIVIFSFMGDRAADQLNVAVKDFSWGGICWARYMAIARPAI